MQRPKPFKRFVEAVQANPVFCDLTKLGCT